jgi:hypothetical protein
VRVIAVDWSGAAAGAERRIWLAEAASSGGLVDLHNGRTREQLAHELLVLIGADSHVVIGFDFGFSFPLWYLDELGVVCAPELWAHVAREGEGWLHECAPPFWGRPGRARPALETHFRRTELAVRARHGFALKSMFQIGGAGAVGTGSIRGMPLLHRLQAAGACVWPFDPPGWPLVVEIYPRLLTGPVVKSRASARDEYLARWYPDVRPIASEDAFDAAVSALVMARHADDLASLPAEPDAELRREGRIWYPGWQDDAA